MKKTENTTSCLVGQKNYVPPMTEVIEMGTQGVLCSSEPFYGFAGDTFEEVGHGGFTMP